MLKIVHIGWGAMERHIGTIYFHHKIVKRIYVKHHCLQMLINGCWIFIGKDMRTSPRIRLIEMHRVKLDKEATAPARFRPS